MPVKKNILSHFISSFSIIILYFARQVSARLQYGLLFLVLFKENYQSPLKSPVKIGNAAL